MSAELIDFGSAEVVSGSEPEPSQVDANVLAPVQATEPIVAAEGTGRVAPKYLHTRATCTHVPTHL